MYQPQGYMPYQPPTMGFNSMQTMNQFQPQVQTQAPVDLTRVTGMEGAKAYQMPPNSRAALFDGNGDIFYVKSTDGAGFATIKAYSFQPLDEAPQIAQEYVTRQEFEDFVERMTNGQQPVPVEATIIEPQHARTPF